MASPISIGSASPVSSLYRKETPSKHADPEFGDEYGLVYFNMFYQGLSSHFPWNVMLAGQSYFKSRNGQRFLVSFYYHLHVGQVRFSSRRSFHASEGRTGLDKLISLIL
jgi:hypothetical protein